MYEGRIFRGVDFGWMQAQWRDCADKDEQMKIFRDMTGATKGEILVALGEAKEAGPKKTGRGEYLPEEKEAIVRMACEGRTPQEIADALGRSTAKAISIQMTKLRAQGIDIPRFQRGGRKRKAADPSLPAVTEPDPVPKPSEPADGDSRIEGLEAYLRALIEEERSLSGRLEWVRGKIDAYRKTFSRLLDLAGGGDGL